MTWPEGALLAGRYRIIEPLGRGGMADVYAAVGVRGEELAIKVLREGTRELALRFEREAELLRRIESPCVCRLVDLGFEQGRRYQVFERLHGETLAERFRRSGALPLATLAPIVTAIFEALEVVHAAGVVHRDLKPSNVFLAQGERIVLLDFGVSKLLGDAPNCPTLTETEATLGTLAYSAPEQIDDAGAADERADLYAVGTIAFRGLAGRLPFDRANLPALVALKLAAPAATLAEATGAQWPTELEAFLATTLARDPAHRYTGASAALRAWRRAIADVGDTELGLAPSHSSMPSRPELDETAPVASSNRRARPVR